LAFAGGTLILKPWSW